MKKWIALFLSLIMILSLCACTGKKSSINNDFSGSATSSGQKQRLTTSSSEIDEIVTNAIFRAVDSSVESISKEINKKEEKNGYIYVYGYVYLFDKYGDFIKSGEYCRDFTVKINVDTRQASCTFQ